MASVAPAPANDEARYDLFLSYRQLEPDASLSATLFRRLEAFRVPKVLRGSGARPRVQRAFRDKEELAASSDLGAAIRDALVRSRFLVVMCSPRARDSKWIDAEIAFFKQLGRGHRILAVLLEGTPAEAFPPSLLGDGTALSQPLAADARGASRAERSKALGDVQLRLLAPILGCNYDDLRRRENERRVRRLVALLAAALVGTVVLSLLAAWALVERSQANDARATAVENERSAVRRLAESQFERARIELLAGRPGPALLHVTAARRLGLDSPSVRVVTGLASMPFGQVVARSKLRGRGYVVRASPDGKWIYVGTEAGVERIAVDDGVTTTLSSLGPCKTIELSDDGARLLAIADKHLMVLDTATAKVLYERDDVFSARLSPDGARIAITSVLHPPVVVELSSGEDHGLLGDADYLGGCFAPNGKLIALIAHRLVGDVSSLRIFNAVSGQLMLEMHLPLQANACAFAPSGNYLAISASSEVDLYNLTSGKSVPFKAHATGLAFSKDSRLLGIAGADGTGIIVVTESARLVWVLHGHSGNLTSLRFTGDDAYAVTSGQDNSVRLWAVGLGLQRAVLLGHWSGVTDTVILPDDQHVVSTSSDRSMRIWKIVSQTPVTDSNALLAAPENARFDDAGTVVAAWTTEGDAVVAHVDGTAQRRLAAVPTSLAKPNSRVAVEVAAAGEQILTANLDSIQTVDPGGNVVRHWVVEGLVQAAAISADGARVAALDETGVTVVATGDSARVRCALEGRSGSYHAAPAISFTSEGDALLVVVPEHHVSILPLTKGSLPTCEAKQLPVASYTGFAQTGTLRGSMAAVGYDDGQIVLFDRRSLQPQVTLVGHTRSIRALALSHDGAFLASGGFDDQIRIWSTSGNLLAELPHGHGTVLALAWRGSDRVLSFGSDGRVRVWSIPRDSRTLEQIDTAIAQTPWMLCGDRVVSRGLHGCSP